LREDQEERKEMMMMKEIKRSRNQDLKKHWRQNFLLVFVWERIKKEDVQQQEDDDDERQKKREQDQEEEEAWIKKDRGVIVQDLRVFVFPGRVSV
jgi:hypothetical protein